MAELNASVALLFRDLLSAGLAGAMSKITAASDAIGGSAAQIAGDSASAARAMDTAADRMGAGYTDASRAIDSASKRISGDLTGAARTADASADRIAGGADRAAQAWRAPSTARISTSWPSFPRMCWPTGCGKTHPVELLFPASSRLVCAAPPTTPDPDLRSFEGRRPGHWPGRAALFFARAAA